MASSKGAFVLALLTNRAFFIDSQRPVPLSLARGARGENEVYLNKVIWKAMRDTLKTKKILDKLIYRLDEIMAFKMGFTGVM